MATQTTQTTGVPRAGNGKWILPSLAAAWSAYAAAFIWRTSFVVAGRRWFCLIDDEMISMTYARNLVEGHGLVWNAGGERVEGFTNLGWVLLMAVIHYFKVPLPYTSICLQIVSALFILAALVATWKLGEELGLPPVARAAAAAFFGFYLPLSVWALQGSEISAIIALAAAALLCMARGRMLAASLLLALSTLFRADMLVMAGAAALLGPALLVEGRTRRERIVRLVAGAGLVALAAGGQLLFNRLSYGDFLPNTYYLKVAGISPLARVERGGRMLLVFLASLGPLLVAWTVVVMARARRAAPAAGGDGSDTAAARRRVRLLLLMASLVAVQALYSVWVGGDIWPDPGGANRYLLLASPFLFLLLSAALWEMARSARVFAALALVSLVWFNAYQGWGSLAEWALARKLANVSTNAFMVSRGRQVEAITAPGARVAVVWAGIIPYFFPGRRYIDVLGFNDARVARSSPRPVRGWVPGHNKWDAAWSIETLGADVMAHTWHVIEPDFKPVLLRGGFVALMESAGDPNPIFVRRGSTRIRNVPLGEKPKPPAAGGTP